MPSKKIEVKCSTCGSKFMRPGSDVKKALLKTGICECKRCAIRRTCRRNERPLWTKRMHKGRQRMQIKTKKGWRDIHVFVVECYIGRAIERVECVHHCDGNKMNNKISNLELMLHGEHTKMHHTGSKRGKECGEKISMALIGKPNKSRLITYEKANEMRKKRIDEGSSYSQLSNIFGVSRAIVANIIKKRSYNIKD